VSQHSRFARILRMERDSKQHVSIGAAELHRDREP